MSGAVIPSTGTTRTGLEQLGWRGWLLDNDANAVKLCRAHRHSPVLHGDAHTFDYASLFAPHSPKSVDYLSLDCDGATLGALEAILTSGVRGRFITIEHDLYRFGPEPRRAMRAALEAAGYNRICGDVCDRELPFEDWWVDPGRVDMSIAERYRCDGCDWHDVVARGDAPVSA